MAGSSITLPPRTLILTASCGALLIDPLNEKGDILHDQAQYWGRRGIHYHQFLQAGENTLNLKLCTLLMDSLNANKGYSSDDYLKRYIGFMTTPGTHRDTYVEEYHRHFFTNFAKGKSPHQCGVVEKHIGGLVGLVPIVLCYRHSPVRRIKDQVRKKKEETLLQR